MFKLIAIRLFAVLECHEEVESFDSVVLNPVYVCSVVAASVTYSTAIQVFLFTELLRDR